MNDIIRSIGSPDLRTSLFSLRDKGWTVSRTRNGHLKLSHPNARHPVFSGSTPSDFRSVRNLESQCRNALDMRGAPDPGAGIGQEAAAQALRLHRAKMRKDKSEFRRMETAFIAPAARPSMSDAGLPGLRARNAGAGRPRAQPAPAPTADVPGIGSLVPPHAQPLMPPGPAAPSGHPGPIASGPPGDLKEAVPELPGPVAAKRGGARRRPRPPRRTVTLPAASVQPDTARPAEVDRSGQGGAGLGNPPGARSAGEGPAGTGPEGQARLLELALRLLTSGYRTLVIGPDMVGKTLLLEGEVALLD